MIKMKKQIMLAAASLSFTFSMMMGANADIGTMTVKEAVKEVNSQIASAENITIDAYAGSISKDNHISTIAVNTKSGLVYADYKAIGIPEMYKKGDKVYWHSDDGKWYSFKYNYNGNYNNIAISAKDKCSIAGVKKFGGKKCIALNTVDSNNSWNVNYYLEASNNKLCGIVTGSKGMKVIMTVDTSTKVKLPAKARKASKKVMSVKDRLAQGMNGVVCVDSIEKIQEKKISSYAELKSYIANIDEENAGVKSVLKKYGKRYFSKNVLYVKSFSTPMPAMGMIAVNREMPKKASSIKLTLTQYNVGSAISTGEINEYAVLAEVSKSSAKKVSIKNIKIKFKENSAYMPNI